MVLLDIMLPGVGGLEVLRRVRATSDAFVILIGARDDEVDRLVGLGLGADDYISTLFSPCEVVARVRHASTAALSGDLAPAGDPVSGLPSRAASSARITVI